DVAVPDELAGHVPRLAQAGPEHDVVQPALQDDQQVLAGLAGLAHGLLVVAAELLLEHAVDARALLLLALLQQVLGGLGTAAAGLAGRVRPDLDRALRRVALGALEEELGLLAAAALAVSTGVAGHVSCLSLSALLSMPQTRRRFGGRQPL